MIILGTFVPDLFVNSNKHLMVLFLPKKIPLLQTLFFFPVLVDF